MKILLKKYGSESLLLKVFKVKDLYNKIITKELERVKIFEYNLNEYEEVSINLYIKKIITNNEKFTNLSEIKFKLVGFIKLNKGCFEEEAKIKITKNEISIIPFSKINYKNKTVLLEKSNKYTFSKINYFKN